MKKLSAAIASLILLANVSLLKADTIAEYRATYQGNTADAGTHWGQSFTAESTGILDTITVYGRTAPASSPPAELTFFVYDVVDSSTLSQLASSTILVPADLSHDVFQPVSASFLSNSLELTAGHQYAFSLYYDSPAGEQINYELSGLGYAGGGWFFIPSGSNYSSLGGDLSISFSVTAVPTVPEPLNMAVMLGGLVVFMAWWQLRQRRYARVAVK